MYRAIPVGNKACAARVQKQKQEMHRRRIREMKVSVDTREPATCALDHLRVNLKKEQLLEERYFQIDRENRILLGKMSEIMKKPGYSKMRGQSGPPSLNRDHRKAELERITAENQNILKRIQKAQPVYNHVLWNESHRRNVSYVKNCCEYPPSLSNTMRKSSSRASGFGLQPRDEARDKQLSLENSSKDNGDVKYVLKEGKQIGDHYYMVEMATDGRSLTITAEDWEGASRKSLELIVNERNTRRLLREYSHDYSAIASLLRVDGDKLLLDTAGGPYDESG